MERLYSFDEVLERLKEGYYVTLDGHDIFYLQDQRVYHRFAAGSYNLSLKEFYELFRSEHFFLYEDNSVFIDDEKDENYYRYYKK